MTEYVYTVVSNKPLALGVGIGNMPNIRHDENGGNLIARDITVRAASNGAAASVNHHMSMELTQRNEA